MMRTRHNAILRAMACAAPVVLLAACAGYNIQFGTTASNLSNFHTVYEMPASSLLPWTARTTPIDIAAPTDESSGVSTLPAAASALPPERPTGSTRTPGR